MELSPLQALGLFLAFVLLIAVGLVVAGRRQASPNERPPVRERDR